MKTRFIKKQRQVGLNLKKRLHEKLTRFTIGLDNEAREIIFDLAKRLGPLNTMEIPTEYDLNMTDQVGFMGEGGGVLFAVYPKPLELLLVEDIKELKNKQFSTFAENRLFCEGTEGLLEILTRYHSVQTETASINAVPDAAVFTNDKATFTDEDREIYGNERTVYVSVVFECGFMMFAFEECIDKNNKVRPQKVFQ